MVEEKTLGVGCGVEETLWNKWVPKKVNVFMWRTLKGKLPVHEKLDKRGIDLDSLLCPTCDDMLQSCSHCLVMCNFAGSVWEKVFSWWKVGVGNAFSIEELFSFNGNVNMPSHSPRMWQGVIWTSGCDLQYACIRYILFSHVFLAAFAQGIVVLGLDG
ncbi:RNA-directed DNA polymerase, eukaryota, reverse transcriptase zinc-binding domain protein [Tanacetum coccineum]